MGMSELFGEAVSEQLLAASKIASDEYVAARFMFVAPANVLPTDLVVADPLQVKQIEALIDPKAATQVVNGPALLKYRQWWSGHNRRGPRTVCVHRVIARMSVRDLARKTLKKAARKTRMGRKKRRGW